MASKIDMLGRRFGRLIVVAQATKSNSQGQARWECRCDCGGHTTASGAHLRYGHTTSCGCLRAERVAEAVRKHGRSHSPEYRTWASMRARCLQPDNKNYHLYGGRGVTICDSWNEFSAFLADMGERPTPRHSIDRIDPDGNYEPDNCRWAIPYTQVINRRVRSPHGLGVQRRVHPSGKEVFSSRIIHGGRLIYLGTHPTATLAAQAYAKAAAALYGLDYEEARQHG